MKAVEIEERDVIDGEHVAAGLTKLRVQIVNVFGIRAATGWVLVDAGLPGSAERIRRWAWRHFGDVAPSAIVLTHAHFDHVGAIESLASAWDVPVYVHRDELPYVTGVQAYPPPDPSVGGGLMARMAPMYPRSPIDLGARVAALPEDGTVPCLPDWEWIHTPGHTVGHVSLFRQRDRALIVGDAFCTTKQESLLAVATQRAELHGPPAYFTTDWEAARDSVEHLARLRPRIVAPGHGPAMAGEEVPRALERLAERFDEVARPTRGRYVNGASHEMHRKPIGPGQHAVLDYLVAGTFFGMGAWLRRRHPAASRLAFMNGSMVLGLALVTDYPGGVWPLVSFRTHRLVDMAQAAVAGLGPSVLQFQHDPEARYFQLQALSEVGVIAATDWEALDEAGAWRREETERGRSDETELGRSEENRRGTSETPGGDSLE